jgi:hypothetical protein
MGKVCDNSRRQAILHVAQNAAKPITQSHNQPRAASINDAPSVQRHHSRKIQIRTAAVSDNVSLNSPRNAVKILVTFRA